MHIAIIGKGTSAIITALKCLKYGHRITIYSDPSKPHLSVGESTTPIIQGLLHEVLDLNIHNLCEQEITSLKTGIKFINWGKGVDFYHNFQQTVAFHFETSKFNPFIHEILKDSGLVEYIEEKVNGYRVLNDLVNVNQRFYNFVVFCSGWEDENEYYKPLLETVNSGILYTQDSVDIDSTYTIHRATEDGWQFGLPFPKSGITKCGYLYDRNITDTEEIKNKMNELGSEKSIEWTPRYAKKLIQNKYCAYNGNKLFFLEPLQALSLHYYSTFAERICDFLKSDRTLSNFHEANYLYIQDITIYQLSLAFHYRYGSIHQTEYWDKVVKNSQKITSVYSTAHDEAYMTMLVADFLNKESKYSSIGVFQRYDVAQLHCGFTQEKFQEIFEKYGSDATSFISNGIVK